MALLKFLRSTNFADLFEGTVLGGSLPSFSVFVMCCKTGALRQDLSALVGGPEGVEGAS